MVAAALSAAAAAAGSAAPTETIGLARWGHFFTIVPVSSSKIGLSGCSSCCNVLLSDSLAV